jgi:hypothetical protein
VPSLLRFHALSNGHGLSLTLSYEIKKKLLGEFSLLAVKTKESSSHQAVAPREQLERANTEDSLTKITIFRSREWRGVCSIITEAGLMMCTAENTYTHTHTHTHTHKHTQSSFSKTSCNFN